MSGTFSEPFERSLAKIRRLAATRGHNYVTLEHVVLAALEEPATHGLFQQNDVSVAIFQDELLEFIERYTPRGERAVQKMEETRGASRVQARAQMIFEIPTGVHVLEMLFEEPHSYAVQLLRKHGIDRDQVSELRARVDRARFGVNQAEDVKQEGGTQKARVPARKKAAAPHFVTNLNQQVRKGAIEALIGRQDEMRRMIQILGRRRKNNVVLVGEPGVGKTALAEGLAWNIERNEVPPALANATLLSLDLNGLVAGTRYRGDFEERMKNLLGDLRRRSDAILFIDEIHTLIGAGAANGTAMDAADFLKPFLTTGELRCIGACTWREYRRVFEPDAALARRFQSIDVREPTVKETGQILMGVKEGYEQHHQVHYAKEVIQSMVDLSVKHLPGRRLPDKAIDIMDETGSRCRMESADEDVLDVQFQDVEHTVALMARIPQDTVSVSAQQSLLHIEQHLKETVFGQDPAIAQLMQALSVARAKLNPEQRPIGSFLFCGPTGVGKTEVCRQLALAMGVKLLRFDMSEYMERHAAARLIGAPPGYVGHEEGGLLTEAVIRQPHAVLLLDEAEKAHPDVMNVLLQVLDYGRLTDSNGREVDFRNLVIALTSNAGTSAAEQARMGFTPADNGEENTQEVKRIFAPEFRNRLDAIVQFGSLDEDSTLAVVGKIVGELQASLKPRGIDLRVDVRARRWLAREGFDPVLGARPMERVVREHVRAPLADKLLDGLLEEGGVVRLSANKSGLKITAKPRASAALVPAVS